MNFERYFKHESVLSRREFDDGGVGMSFRFIQLSRTGHLASYFKNILGEIAFPAVIVCQNNMIDKRKLAHHYPFLTMNLLNEVEKLNILIIKSKTIP